MLSDWNKNVICQLEYICLVHACYCLLSCLVAIAHSFIRTALTSMFGHRRTTLTFPCTSVRKRGVFVCVCMLMQRCEAMRMIFRHY